MKKLKVIFMLICTLLVLLSSDVFGTTVLTGIELDIDVSEECTTMAFVNTGGQVPISMSDIANLLGIDENGMYGVLMYRDVQGNYKNLFEGVDYVDPDFTNPDKDINFTEDASGRFIIDDGERNT